ncbi:MAG: L,D-transpeptidase [Gammaproteobacteria bacterium]|nr:L,D-transpeptidase [Gammaproteobacteria bacterium]MCH9743902.1 L,D-transpeptidase [Gammaproteobacteria bacterium]
MNKIIKINVNDQVLSAYQASKRIFEFDISTAAKGVGQQYGSEQTPLGKHIIRAKIGTGAALGAIFKGRRPTGEIYNAQYVSTDPNTDLILTRILWLSGSEKGYNRLGNVDTMRRYIYIHGSPERKFKHKPFTHGCIGMYCRDITELFDWAPIHTPVIIT